MSKSEQKRICIQSECAVRDELREQLEAKDKEINELKKKRTKGEINEAYAKTIEADKDVISKLKSKVNKLQAKCARRKENQIKLNAENKRMADVVEAAEMLTGQLEGMTDAFSMNKIADRELMAATNFTRRAIRQHKEALNSDTYGVDGNE